MRFPNNSCSASFSNSSYPPQRPIIMKLIQQPLRRLNSKLQTLIMLWKVPPQKRLVPLTQIQPGFRKQTQKTLHWIYFYPKYLDTSALYWGKKLSKGFLCVRDKEPHGHCAKVLKAKQVISMRALNQLLLFCEWAVRLCLGGNLCLIFEQAKADGFL